VEVTAELMRCELPGRVGAAVEVHSGCEPSDEFRDDDQREINSLGEAIAGTFPAR
jgi:hypothetical protein